MSTADRSMADGARGKGRTLVSAPRWPRVTVVSPGLIGGSVARGLRGRRLAREVVVVARHEAALRGALDAGAADVGTTDLGAGVAGASLVVLCAPVGALPGMIRAAWPHLAAGAVMTDVGSVKRSVVEASRGCPPRSDASFVGGHPMAGSERSGFEASDGDLFEGRLALLTPTADTPEAAVVAVTALWESLGSTVRRLSAEAHDHLVAQISHLPHLAAYALVSAAEADALSLAGRGFVDTTRVAASAEALWTDIFRENRRPLLAALARYEAILGRWREFAARGDWATLEAELGRARELREKLT
jgi:prephenate dehydrogenase